MKKVYAAQENKDKTEGRGPMLTFALFDNLEEAVKAVQDRGVMGFGTGEVSEQTVYSSFTELLEATGQVNNKYKTYNSGFTDSKKVYGYRKDWKGQWNYGYVDNRDAPEKDPDYVAYKALQEKLNKKYNGRIPE